MIALIPTRTVCVRLCLAVLFLMMCGPGTRAQSNLLQNPYGRSYTNLDGRWHYIIDPYETGYYNYRRKPYDEAGQADAGIYANKKQANPSALIEYDFERSATLKVPGDWNSQLPELQYYEGTVWYQRDFVVHLQAGKQYLLYLNAVSYEAHVYVNGQKLGSHVGGFTPFQFDVTSLLKDGNNFIVVKADNVRHKEAVPTDNTDWWNYGGITRDVLLVELPAVYVANYKCQLTSDAKNIEGFVQLSQARANEAVTVRIPGLKLTQQLVTDASGRATFSVRAGKVNYWSPEQPTLYDVAFATVADSVHDRIGFRTIATRGYDILLNGKPIFLKGISIHEENPLIPGRVRGRSDARMLLQSAKDLGCNFARLAHYPHTEYMSRLADEMGLLLWEEIPVYWTIDWKNEATFNNAAQQLSDLITRDQNRASVIVWSVGNETPLSPERFTFMSGLVDKVRVVDKSRLVSAALEVHQVEGKRIVVNDSLGSKLDIASFNEYVGWYTKEMPWELSQYSFDVQFNKPVIISELGADALAGFHADSTVRFSEEYQASFYRNQLKLINTIPNLRGMTPWILYDFRSPKRMHPVYQNGWNRKGLISETGVRKQAYYLLQEFYSGK